MAARQQQLTPERKEAFLGELEQHGVVARAARLASPHSARGAVQSFYDERERDPEFASAWAEATEQAKGAVEYEIHRRAVDGFEEPIYGGRYREKVVGTVRKYSDRLLELRARALMPQYRPRSKFDLGGEVGLKKTAKEELAETFSKMNTDQRAEFRELLIKQQALMEKVAGG